MIIRCQEGRRKGYALSVNTCRRSGSEGNLDGWAAQKLMPDPAQMQSPRESGSTKCARSRRPAHQACLLQRRET